MLRVVGGTLVFVGKTYRCAYGKNGFTGDKQEGDGKTPTGIFPLRECWYRADKMAAPVTKLPLKIIHQNDGWCDDVNAECYNRHILVPSPSGRGQGEGFYYYTPADLIERARELRKDPALPELKLWHVLKNRQMNGQKFRRQHPIGPYIADFYCDDMKLVIELDGESHFTADGIKHDEKRSKFLEDKGCKIIRFTNKEISEDLEAVVESVFSITALTPALSQGERELKKTPRHEKLWREDDMYDLIIPLGYNDGPIVPGKGSAIFLHIAKPDYSGTEGCIALSQTDLLEILPMLSSAISICTE